jgi:hypothetical protein
MQPIACLGFSLVVTVAMLSISCTGHGIQCFNSAGGEKSCTCYANGSPNDVVCTGAGYEHGYCCASKDWPSGACGCWSAHCAQVGTDYCECGTDDTGSPPFPPGNSFFVASCAGDATMKCCLYRDTCICAKGSCPSSELEVPSCSVDVLAGHCADHEPSQPNPVPSCTMTRQDP